MPTIGRLFYEIGGETDRLQADLRKAVDMAKNAGLDVKRAGQSFLASFNGVLSARMHDSPRLKLLPFAFALKGARRNDGIQPGSGFFPRDTKASSAF